MIEFDRCAEEGLQAEWIQRMQMPFTSADLSSHLAIAVCSAKKSQRTFSGDFKGICKARHDVRYRAGSPLTNSRLDPWESGSDNE